MPISLSGIDDGTTQFGIGSYLAVGDRTARGTAGDISAIGNFYNIPYLVQTAEIAGNAPGIEVPIVGDSPDDFPRQQGPLDIINGFTLPAYTTKMEPFYRQLLNDNRALDDASVLAISETGAGTRPAQIGGRVARFAADGLLDGAAIDTTPTTSFAAQPTRPIRVFVDAAANVSADTAVTIIGTDYHDTRISEVITIANGNQTAKTNQYFKTVSSIASDPAIASADVGEDDVATERPYRSLFWENTESKLTYGMDVYVRKGIVPNTYREVFLDSLSFSMSRDGAVAYTFATVGKRPVAHRALNGTSTTAEDTSSWTAISREAFTGWQCGIFYQPEGGGAIRRLPAIDTTVTLSNNVAFTPTVTGRRTPGSAFRNRRTVTFEGTMEYRAEDINLIEDVLGNQFLEGAYLEMVNAATGGFPYKVRYLFGKIQFTNLPDAPISEEGVISRPMSMIAVPDGNTPALRILMEVLTPVELAALTL